jgi:transposase-like protein
LVLKNRIKYSDDEKASALTLLAVNNGNVKRTARTLGIPRSTLTAWAQARGIGARVTELCHLKKGTLADKFEEVARAMLDGAMSPAKIEDAPLKDVMLAVGICIDKMVMLRGCRCSRRPALD